MLRDLSIRNLAIAEEATLSFRPGFTVVTGETGAGKSILVDALMLAAGSRATADLLRQGADRLVVAARFEADGSLAPALAAAGCEPDGEVLLRREVSADGRGRAFLNDEPVTARAAARVGELLLEIHGQGGEWALVEEDTALSVVDDFAGAAELSNEVARRAERWRELDRQKRELEESRADRERTLDRLRFEMKEIDDAMPEGLDEEALRAERNRLAHADHLREHGGAALEALSEGEPSAADRLGEAARALAELADIDPGLSEARRDAEELKAKVADLALTVRHAVGDIEADPARLDALEARLARIERVKRKYGGSAEAVREHRDRAQRDHDLLANIDDSLDRIARELAAAARAYEEAAAELSRRRVEAAARLSEAVARELSELAMVRARLRVALVARAEEVHPKGRERADFLFAPNPGEAEKDLARIASGGELSRVQLAIECARLSRERARAPRTLVFDEVDAGIGGKVAEVVGRKLKQLARRDQVLCVTHVPQIAAMADWHFRVEKKVSGGRTRAVVAALSDRERVEEIARMLGGASVTATARDHARALLEAR